MQEFADITSTPPPGCTIKLAKDDDMNLWDVIMDGPSDSVYSVGILHTSRECSYTNHMY